VSLACALLRLAGRHTAAAEVRLATKGQALLPVVISAQASDTTRMVAAELADYLGKISGARFEVRMGAGATGVVLGTLAEFPQPELARALEIRNRFDGKEAYVIRPEG